MDDHNSPEARALLDRCRTILVKMQQWRDQDERKWNASVQEMLEKKLVNNKTVSNDTKQAILRSMQNAHLVPGAVAVEVGGLLLEGFMKEIDEDDQGFPERGG